MGVYHAESLGRRGKEVTRALISFAADRLRLQVVLKLTAVRRMWTVIRFQLIEKKVFDAGSAGGSPA